MGSTVKTLQRLMTLTHDGYLAPGANICDIGATQLFGDGTQEGVRSFLNFYAARYDGAMPSDKVADATIDLIAKGGFLGDLLVLAGFRYTALDIFHATNTILFDLNLHAPGPALKNRFDLVMNFGTTEHVINQLRAFQTIHDLTRVGGIMYHDLPMAGYLNHALFRYDPLFFRSVMLANSYAVLLETVSLGAPKPVPEDLRRIGFNLPEINDVGLEIVLRRGSDAEFQVPLEVSTALSVDTKFGEVQESEYVTFPPGTAVHYGIVSGTTASGNVGTDTLGRAVLRVARRVLNLLRGGR